MSNADLPFTGFVRLPTILKLIPIGKSSWWLGVKNGHLPAPIKLGQRTTAWRVEDIRALIESHNNQSSCNRNIKILEVFNPKNQ